MELVEVKDYQCHPDGEEVVLLNLDKPNDSNNFTEVQELILEDVNVENKDDNTNGIVIVETCDDVSSNGDQMEITDVEEIPNTSSKVDMSCNNLLTADGDVSHTSDASIVIDVLPSKKEDCPEVNDNQDIKATNTTDTTNKINEIEETGNDTKSINVSASKIENTEQSVEKNNSSIEIKNPDGSVLLKKDKITVTIPQHIAGRDISSLTEETLPRSGKCMLKPRFGVKVPYIHMTSQIVTQDEIAKELFERFQQKYPLTRVDKPDKLFSMKLTHRLANKINPLKTDIKIKDESKSPVKNLPNNKINTKNELANKESEKIEKIEKIEIKNSLDSNKSAENNLSKIQTPDDQLSNITIESSQVADSQHIDQIRDTLQSLDQITDQHINNVSEERNDEKISSNEELIAILEDFETIEAADTNGNKVPETSNILETVNIIEIPSVPETINVIEIPSETPKVLKQVMKRKIIRNSTRTKRSKPKLDPEIEKQIALKQLQEVSRPKRFDSHFAKKKAENDKKLLIKSEPSSAQKRKKPTSDDVPEVKIAIDQYIKSYTDKRQSTVKMDSTSNDETVNDNVDEVETKTNDVAKARTMREINRLLGDEGAINMIYSLEKRRSPGNNNSKSILPSTRRKKKDLMLKTKLVKNAMLKMSSPTTSSSSTNRLGRRSDVCTPSTSPENKCTRKTSMDSQGSDQSIKCLGNFSGRKTIPADESKIIRKHSSSSEASSIGGSPIPPVSDAVPIPNNNVTTKHVPVIKTLRVYTRKNKISDILNSSDQSLNEGNKGTNKSFVKTKSPIGQKVKKQPVQLSSKLSRSLAESIKQEIEDNTYNEITIRRYDGVVHITLTPVSTIMKNALNISVMEELMKELNNLESDDSCKVVLISSAGRIFCQGLDIAPLIHDDLEKCKEAAVEIASTLKNFITCLSNFPKLLVAGVDGAAVGLGATMLVHFDLVFASDKATFETPYAQLGHIAEGAATTMLSRLAFAEMVMGSQRLTAGQAHYYGLVTRTVWPDRFHDELIPLVKSLARQSMQAMKTSKALKKQETKEKLAKALESETIILVQQWTSDECQQNLQAYLKDTVDNINT